MSLTVAGLASMPMSIASAESATMSLLVVDDHRSSANVSLIWTSSTAFIIWDVSRETLNEMTHNYAIPPVRILALLHLAVHPF